MSKARELREQLRSGTVVAASVYDPLSARLACAAGFKSLHLSGFGVEASLIGAPDMGIMSMTELAAQAHRIVDAVAAPLLSDIDTGFGGINNVIRTVQYMERVGVAGIHIEDQSFPKLCPLLDGRKVLDIGAAVGRIKAALDARVDADFVVVARSDADVHSISEVIERCNRYLDAGADMVMPATMNVDGRPFSALGAEEQMQLYRRLCKEIEGPVMSLGFAFPAGHTATDMVDAGFAYVMVANMGLTAAANALLDVYSEFLAAGSDAGFFKRNPGRFCDRMKLLDALDVNTFVAREAKYSGTD